MSDRAKAKLGFIVGGVQKAGTTTMFSYLSTHPMLCPPSQKELHFFDNESIDWRDPDYSTLSRYFSCDADDHICFDCTPIYLFWPPSLQRIFNYNPDVKLIFIFRDPIERAWSHWKMEVARQYEKLPFGLAIRQGRWRLRGIDVLHSDWRVYSYVERGFYGAQLERLLSLFPSTNILFLSFSELVHRHEKLLNDVSAFLGIGGFPALAPRHEHRSADNGSEISPADVVYLRTIYSEDLKLFSSRSGIDVSEWLSAA